MIGPTLGGVLVHFNKYPVLLSKVCNFHSVISVEPVGTPLRLGAPWHFMGRPADERAGINMENVLNIEHFDR